MSREDRRPPLILCDGCNGYGTYLARIETQWNLHVYEKCELCAGTGRKVLSKPAEYKAFEPTKC